MGHSWWQHTGRSVEGGMGCEGSGENREGLEVVSDSGAQERIGHNGGGKEGGTGHSS